MSKEIPPGQAAIISAITDRFGYDRVPSKTAIAMACVATKYGISTVTALMGKAVLAGRVLTHIERNGSIVESFIQVNKECQQ